MDRFSAIVGSSGIGPGMPDYSWFQVETGILLPSDYLAWAETYPSLEICSELLVSNLISGTDVTDIPGRLASMVSKISMDREYSPLRRTVYDDAGHEIGAKPWMAVYPEPHGLLPWGIDTKGGIYMWNTEADDPDSWNIVVYDGVWREFNSGFLEFLIRLLQGDFVDSPIFLKGWPWIPAIREFYEGGMHGAPGWHTPKKWERYFEEYRARRKSNSNWSDLSWIDQFKDLMLSDETLTF